MTAVCGDCFGYAWRTALDWVAKGKSYPKLYVVHANVFDRRTRKRFWHAWLEAEGIGAWDVYLNMMSIKAFRRAMRVRDMRRYEATLAVRLAGRIGNLGPWTPDEEAAAMR